MLWCLLPLLASAQDQSGARPIQPYIDQLKQKMRDEDSKEGQTPPTGSYTEELKKKLKVEHPSDGDGESYTEHLKKTDPERYGKPATGPSYSDQEKSRLGPKADGGAIQAVRDGKSELRLRREGPIHWAAGFKFGAVTTRNISGSSSATNGNYGDYYTQKWTPDLEFFFEYQPIRSETFGSLGLVAGFGFTYNDGKGLLKLNLTNPYSTSGAQFGLASLTNIKFISAPLSLGLNYRLNLFKYVRPYIQGSPTLEGYVETRSDGRNDVRGYSPSFQTSAGVNFLLDDLAKGIAWDLYDEFGIKHNYLTIDYTKLTTLSGDVHFDASTVSLGFTYEF